MRILLCSVALAVALPTASSVIAAEIVVPDQYPTIQSAINASVSGDLITVMPGTYNERLDIGPRNITLKGMLGAAATIIDPQGVGGVVIYSGHGAANGWTLDGFTIRNGLDSGVYITGVSATVKNCVFLNNQASRGGGAHVRDGANVTFDGCTFTQNKVTSGQYKGGALFVEGAAASVLSTVFRENGAQVGAAIPLTGGAVASVSAQVSLSNCQFISNSLSSSFGLCSGDTWVRGGATAFEGNSSVAMSDCQFQQNQAVCSLFDVCYYSGAAANSYGGAVYAVDSTSLTLTRCQFAGDKATAFGQVPHCCSAAYSRAYGGAVFSTGGALAVIDCSFAGIASVAQGGAYNYGRISYGGAIYRDGASATITGTSFQDCSALGDSPDGRGGAIYLSGSLTISGSTVTNCRSISGGAIFIPSSSAISAQGLQVSGCSADAGSGGAIWLTGGTRNFTNCTFTNNTAQGAGDHRGGAIYAEGGAQVNFTDCGFTGNRALSTGDNGDRWTWGGACAMFGVTPRYTRCTFTDNAAISTGNGGGTRGAHGGATAEYDSDAVFSDCVMTGNRAEVVGNGAQYARGGTVHLWNSDSDFVRTTIVDGRALPLAGNTSGGGVWMENVSRPGFTYCTITDSDANEGGALYIANSEPYLVSTAFRRNTANTRGGAMLVDGSSTPYILECEFEQNTAPQGGAVRTLGSGTNLPFIVNSSFCGNTADAINGSILGGEGNITTAACSTDCNGNGTPDTAEIAAGAPDVDANGILDACQADCNANGLPDAYELGQNTVSDCNGNGTPDSCDIASGLSGDANSNGVPDECELTSARLVPFEYGSITAAINAAQSGDTIFLAPGAYYEKFSFGNKQLTLKSVGGASVTYIDGNGQNGTLLTINGGQTTASVVDGITFWYAQGGYAIYIQNASPTIRNCRLLFNQVADGAAFRIDAPSNAQIFDCLVESNLAYSTGGGLWTNTNPTFTRTTFRKNTANYRGGAASLNGGTAKFDSCSFTENSAQGGGDHRGGAIWASSTVNFSAVNCTFTSNIATSAGDWGDRYGRGGACAFDNAYTSGANPPATFDHCTFNSNVARGSGNGGYTRLGHGGAIFDYNSDLSYSFCTFTSNKAEVVGSGAMQMYGGAIYADYSSPKISDCTFQSNSGVNAAADGSVGGALFYDHASNGNITRCTFNSNTAYRGGAFYLAGNSQPNILNSEFIANGASYRGGAVYANASPGFFYACAFRQNTAPTDGGSAIFGEGATGPSVYGSTFCGNPGADVVGVWTSNQNTTTEVCNDCNSNGIDDAEDISSGGAPDCNGNGRPDGCEADGDGDGVIDACDGCPNDPGKIHPGVCGCGLADTDADGDGTPDCHDPCPNDPAKTDPGICGCGVADGDSDGDGTPDCHDPCPNDPAKTDPGICGCGVADGDSDGDGLADCIDNCPGAPNSNQSDCNGDGVGDACAAAPDCNGNGIGDDCDIAAGAPDVDQDGTPDSCEPDCNANLIPDDHEIATGQVTDCNLNGIPDPCDVATGTHHDSDGDGVLDECEVDCNENGIIDLQEIAKGLVADCDANQVIDSCEDGSTSFAGSTAPWGGLAPLVVAPTGLPEATGPVRVRVEAIGDLDALNEFAVLRIGGLPKAAFFGTNGLHCAASPQLAEHVFTAAEWNQMLVGGSITLVLEAPSMVSVDECPNSMARLSVNYQNQGSDCDLDGESNLCEIASGTQPDCDGDRVPDACAIAAGSVVDCNSNGLPDSCDVVAGEPDCNSNGVPDACDVVGGALDCDANGVPDACDIASGAPDCNGDGLLDSCQVLDGSIVDCNANGVPDVCDVAAATPDCNANGIPDSCDIASGASADVDSNGVPDECKTDCNANGLPDTWEILTGAVLDCDGNGVPDSCDITAGSPDCNANGVPDSCDISSGSSSDVDGDGVPDGCQADCNGNGTPDPWDVANGVSADCNSNGNPDECDLAAGAPDCNHNGVIDSCDIANGEADKNANQIPDFCELAMGDFDLDGQVGGSDLALLLSLWGLPNAPICDLNHDGLIEAGDLAILLGNWS